MKVPVSIPVAVVRRLIGSLLFKRFSAFHTQEWIACVANLRVRVRESMSFGGCFPGVRLSATCPSSGQCQGKQSTPSLHGVT